MSDFALWLEWKIARLKKIAIAGSIKIISPSRYLNAITAMVIFPIQSTGKACMAHNSYLSGKHFLFFLIILGQYEDAMNLS
ncbi:MAG: hypothetical protein NPIRA03_16810 [Nitrospirales bacterium]|nr:MAG: hypothetical protein NPIRA03_16810 [Nitrospirales bacterium]